MNQEKPNYSIVTSQVEINGLSYTEEKILSLRRETSNPTSVNSYKIFEQGQAPKKGSTFENSDIQEPKKSNTEE